MARTPTVTVQSKSGDLITVNESEAEEFIKSCEGKILSRIDAAKALASKAINLAGSAKASAGKAKKAARAAIDDVKGNR